MANENPSGHDECNQERRSIRSSFSKKVIDHSRRLFVGEFQADILRSIRFLGHKAHGTDVHDHIEKIQNREISAAQVYAALSKLHDLGLISTEVDKESSAGRRGRPKKIYKIETSGLRMLDAINALDSSMSHKEGALEDASNATKMPECTPA